MRLNRKNDELNIPMPLPALYEWMEENKPEYLMPVGMMRQLALTPGSGFRALVLPGAGTSRKKRIYVRPADAVSYAILHTIN